MNIKNTPNILQPSIQSLYVEMLFNDTLISSATCFVVEGSGKLYIITNRHNVTGKNNLTGEPLDQKFAAIPNRMAVWHHFRNNLGAFKRCVYNLLDSTENPLWFEHPTMKSKVDFVVYPLPITHDLDYYPYQINDDNYYYNLKPTDIVSVIGFPFGLTSGNKETDKIAIWATGFIASEPQIDHEGLPKFLIDCRTRKGQSGSPVVFHRNPGGYPSNRGFILSDVPTTKLLGIYSGRINKESDLGIVWKIDAIKELIDSIV